MVMIMLFFRSIPKVMNVSDVHFQVCVSLVFVINSNAVFQIHSQGDECFRCALPGLCFTLFICQ